MNKEVIWYDALLYLTSKLDPDWMPVTNIKELLRVGETLACRVADRYYEIYQAPAGMYFLGARENEELVDHFCSESLTDVLLYMLDYVRRPVNKS